jgi:PAS domain S-box-containing protein
MAEDPDYLQLNAIVDLATFPVVACSRAGEVIKFNKAASQVFRIAQADAQGRDILELFAAGSALTAGRPAAEVLETFVGSASGKEERGARFDGSTFPMRVSVSKVETKDCYMFTLLLEDITRELADKESLKAEQRKTAAIMNSALNAIITTDNSGAIELINTSACRIFGVEQENAGNLASLLLLENGSHPPEESMGEYLHEAAGTVLELVGRRTDGSTFPMRMSVSEVDSDGKHLFTAILRDVTEEKENQALVAAEQRKTAAIMNSALNAIITTDSQGRFELVNTSACRIFGLTQGQTDGKSMSSLIVLEDGSHPPDDSMGSYLHSAAGTVRELEGRRADGSTFPMRMSVSEVNSEGQHLFTAILRDITKEKLDKSRVEQEQRKTAAIMNSALNAIITTDRDGYFELINTSALHIFGLAEGKTEGQNIASLLLLDDGSQPSLDGVFEYLHGAAGTVRELQGRRADGSTFPMRMSISEVSSDGQHLFTAILRDITKERQHQAAVDREQRKTAAIMNSALNAIITTDNHGTFELINTSACRIFGLTQGQTEGQNIASLLLLDDGSPPTLDGMEEFLHAASGTVRELQGRRTDGSTFPMRMSISEVNSDGQHLFTAILRDITKEKEHDARVHAEQRKTAAIMNSALNAIITTDNCGAIELINTSACRIFGVEQKNAGNLSSLLLLEDGSHPPEDSMGKYLHEAAGTVRELEGCRADGSTFPMRMSVSEVNSEGQHLFTAILRDVTKEKEDQARLNAANQIIKLEKSKLQALLDSTVVAASNVGMHKFLLCLRRYAVA